MDEKHTFFNGYSAREIVMPAAQHIVSHFGKQVGDVGNICDAICFAAISGRYGALYDDAVAFAPDIKRVKDHFSRYDIHNPLYLKGLHNFTAHHNKPGSQPGDAENFNGISSYSALDQLAIMIDKASACTGGVSYLDEIALHMLKCAENRLCDPAYVRFFLENYGTQNSFIEIWYKSCVEQRICRVPCGLAAIHVDKQKFMEALSGSLDGPTNFPRLFSPFSPLPTQSERKLLAIKLANHDSLAAMISLHVETLPSLTAERIKTDIAVIHAPGLGIKRTFAEAIRTNDFQVFNKFYLPRNG